jgi:DNA repair exonuclease SbcCD nuclease subunit
VRVNDVPKQFLAVLSGHVHRAQVLQEDLRGQRLSTPIIYPGAIERTSFAERNEQKGYFILGLKNAGKTHGLNLEWIFRRLPARPMVIEEISAQGVAREKLEKALRGMLHKLPGDAIVQIRVRGALRRDARSILTAGYMRELAPPTMNVEVMLVDERNRSSRRW